MKKLVVVLLFSFITLVTLGQTDQLEQQAFAYLEAEEFSKAGQLFEELILQYYEKEEFNKYANAYTGLMAVKFEQEKDDEFFQIANEILPKIKKLPNVQDSTIAKFYMRIGELHRVLDEFDKAFNDYKLAYDILKQYPASESFAKTTAGFGYVWRARGDNIRAIEYFRTAANILKQKNKRPSDRIIYQNNIGIMYELSLMHKLALEYFFTSLQDTKYLKNSINKRNRTRVIYSNIGRVYYSLEKYDSAILWYQKGIAFSEAHHLSPDLIYHNLAYVYIAQEKYRKALEYLNKCYAIRKTKYKNRKASPIARLQDTYGKAYIGLENYDSALWHLQVSLINFLPTLNDSSIYINPSLETTSSEDVLLLALGRKAIAFTGKALQSKAKKDEDMAIATFWKSIELIDKMRQRFEVQGSKSSLANRTWWVFDAAIKGCLDLYKATGKQKYQQLAFQFVEESKAVLTQDAVAESLAQQNAGVPDSVRHSELDLKKEIAKIENSLYQAERKKKVDEANKIRTELLKKREELNLFSKRLEKQYPTYYQLKYRNQKADLIAIQAQLSPQQAIIEYFVGEADLHIFFITKENLEVQSFPYSAAIDQLVTQFREGLDPKGKLTDLDAYKLYVQSAYQLQQIVLGSVLEQLPQHINKLTIVTDGMLSYVPFELLLTEPANLDVYDYRQLAYLLKGYTINYAYAASLLHTPDLNKPTENGVLAFAPMYTNTSGDSVEIRAFGTTRDRLAPLLWNNKEVEQISDHLATTIYRNETATEAKFKELASNYRLIHLAMHGLLDDDNPMQSRLAFTKANSETDDSYLNVYELYNMELNADLAILSACNTGYGRYVRGEGIVSLGQAFAYAGCPSVMLSHWSVDDRATSQLMNLFYKNLAEGMDKAESLRLAKLRYLETAKPREASPIFWGSFTLIGDDSPIGATTNWMVWIVVGVLLVGALIIWYRRSA